MKTVKMIALRNHRYGTREIKAGEEYEVAASHALPLEAAKTARRAQPEAKKYKRRDMRAEG